MVLFVNDYQAGCIPEILEVLTRTNMEQTPGYGKDPYCAQARQLIKECCALPSADVHFLVGGTQTNATVIAASLRPYQGVVCAHTGHIAVHETGAIEHGAHKVLALASENGKLSADAVDAFVSAHFGQDSPEHEVQPGMVYVSYSTELGTLYSKQELQQLREVCNKWKLPLFIDGARLGYGLASEESDISLQELAALADVFYIGGTKQGALFGEAVVINNDALKQDFRYFIKQNGGLLAKGRLLGLQFLTLFQDNLYMKYARKADVLAQKIAAALTEKGYEFFALSSTNQIFPIIADEAMQRLGAEFTFDKWCRIDEKRCAYRICTSWATEPENVDKLISLL